MLIAILLTTCVLCAIAFKYYGNFLNKRCRIDDDTPTPAHTNEDGVDFVPTRAAVVFGHHFSSIAGTGPIVGPVFAGIYFGWGPAWLWIILGCIFVGGVHDFGSTLLSLRNSGRSIAEVSTRLIGPWTGRLFMIFVLAALIYVLVVFLDLTAENFMAKPAVATASGWFILSALIFGFISTRTKIPFGISLLIFVPLTFLGLWFGHVFPAPDAQKFIWIVVLLSYCLIAAVMPVNILLQPRDFLSAFFLYAILLSGIGGVVFGVPAIEGEFFKGWYNETANPGYLVPGLFIIIACGACSGFHSIVSSGTTSKQINKETDVRKISYGAMLVEGILATLSLGTVIVLTSTDIAKVGGNPNLVFAGGFAKFLSAFGIPTEIGIEFALLGLTTFLLTTLDTCTRLCRFILEELLEWRSELSRYLGTSLVLILPAFFALQTFDGQPAWKAVWPMFGATNQLLAGLALVTIVVFLRSQKIKAGFATIPAVIMLIMPLSALLILMQSFGPKSVIGMSSIVMFGLGLLVAVMAFRLLTTREKPTKELPVTD